MNQRCRWMPCLMAFFILAAVAPAGVAGTDGSLSKNMLTVMSADDQERLILLEQLYQRLLKGEPFSKEEHWVLDRYGWGEEVLQIEADVVISRALYDYYVAHRPLDREQQAIFNDYELYAKPRENAIADYKEWLSQRSRDTENPSDEDTRASKESLEQRNAAAAAAAAPRAPRAAPPNDLCSGAEAIPAAGPFPYLTAVTADITDATITGDPSAPTCTAGTPSRSIWYTFTPSTTAAYTFSVCADAPTGSTVDDTILAVYTSSTGACGGTYIQVGCDDDSCTSENFQSVITNLFLTTGTNYFIVVWKYGATAPTVGNTAIQMRVNQSFPTANDTCAGAIALTLNTPVTGTTALAANDYQVTATNPPFSGIGQTTTTAPGRDVVYTFTAPSAGTYSFRVTGYNTGYNPVLHVTSVCSPATPPTFTAAECLAAANRTTAAGAEEVMCLSLAASQQVWVFVDELASSALGSAFTIEVTACARETEPNGTPATASAIACNTEGSLGAANDQDFYSIGTPAAGSRVFAMVDAIAAGSQDLDLRVNTATTTLEYDDDNNDLIYGSSNFAPNIAGAPLTGVATYLQVTYFNVSATTTEPYRLYYVVQPPIASAVAETEPNGTTATASYGAANYFSGVLSTSADVDIYKFKATAGELLYLGLDLDPTRTNNPFNGKLDLLNSTGAVLVAVDDANLFSSTTAGATLTSTTPYSPGEAIAWRARYTGIYYAKVYHSGGANTLDYLLSIARNCTTGGGLVAPSITPEDPIVCWQGGPTESCTFCSVGDDTTPVENLVVTLTTIPAGIHATITGRWFEDINGDLAADCGATLGPNYVGLTVTDEDGCSNSTNYMLVVGANPNPTLGNYPETTVTCGQGTTVTPDDVPSDNGSVSTVTAAAPLFTGTFSGDPATGVITVGGAVPVGDYTVTVTATDNCGATGTSTFTLHVVCPVITVNPSSVPAGTVGAPYGQQFTSTGGTGAVTYSLTGSLPTGVTWDGTDTISGTPAQFGTFPFRVTATDAAGCTGHTDYSLVVNCPTVTVNPASVSAGTVGAPCSQQFTNSGGYGAVTYALTGSLPTGVTWDGTDTISGTPAQFGTFPFRVTATDAAGCQGFTDYSLVINCPTVTVNPASVAAGTVGAVYNQQFTNSGGYGAVTYALTGSLPTGVTWNGTDTISGTPAQFGTFPFRVTATDAAGCTGFTDYSLVINCPTISVTPATVPAGTVGATYSQQFTSTGGYGAVTYALTGSLPAGVTWDGTDTISGIPAAFGTFPFRVTATDAAGCQGFTDYSLLINCPTISVTPATVPAGTAFATYNQAFSSTGGYGTVTYAFSGSLPAGVTWNGTDAISGTPTVTGTFPFRVTATDAAGCQGFTDYSLLIDCQPITVSPATVPAGTYGTPYSQTFSAARAVYAITLSLTGSLPTGVTWNGTDTISGTPTQTGPFNFTVTATDSNNCTGHTDYTLAINPAASTTAITGDINPSVYGQSVSFTATVAAVAPATGTPTGTVNFYDGATLLGPSALVGGIATFPTAALGAGTHSVTAVYAGDTNFTGSTSPLWTQNVNPAATTIAITSDLPDPSNSGQAVTVTYTVTVTAPGAGAPAGTVTVSDSVDSGAGTPAAGTCTVSLTTLGARTLTATYGGDANFQGSVSAGVAHTVNYPAPAITGLNPPSTAWGGPAFTLAVTGTNYFGTSVVQWNGNPLVTTFGDGSHLTAAVPGALIAAPGSAAITVFNPPPGGGTSNTATFLIDDADGVDAAVENAGPNGGDGNYDGTPDANQANITTLPRPDGGWITVVATGCGQLENVQAYTEATAGGGVYDPSYDFPFGLVGFQVHCSSVGVTIFYHGAPAWSNPHWREFGISQWPPSGPPAWYDLPATFATSSGVPTASFTLTDNTLGDNSATAGLIVEPGGFAGPQGPIPTLGEWGLLALLVLLAGAGLGLFARRG